MSLNLISIPTPRLNSICLIKPLLASPPPTVLPCLPDNRAGPVPTRCRPREETMYMHSVSKRMCVSYVRSCIWKEYLYVYNYKIYTIFTGGIVKNLIHPENNGKSYFFKSFYIKKWRFYCRKLKFFKICPFFYPSAWLSMVLCQSKEMMRKVNLS